MSDISPGYGVTFVGPFQPEHKVLVDGLHISHLSAIPIEDGAKILLSLDGRFLIDGTPEEVAKWVRFIANAMAVSAGYAYFGSEKKHERFATPMSALATPKPQLRIVAETPDG